jgi:hypothetical protein
VLVSKCAAPVAFWRKRDSALGPGRLWRDRDFLRFWSAQTISQFGSHVSALALPFVAILVLKATAFQIAALSAVEFVPFVFSRSQVARR